MTLKLVSQRIRQDWVALSSDDKPQRAVVGATLTLTDTGEIYIYNGTTWVFLRDVHQETYDESINQAVLLDMRRLLRRINTHLQAVTGIDVTDEE